MSISLSSTSGNLSTIIGSIKVTMGAILSFQPSSAGQTDAFINSTYYVSASLIDGNGNPIDGQNITISSSTDSSSTFNNTDPSGPVGTGIGSLAQTTGTYSNGCIGETITFDQLGTQTLIASYTNGSVTKTAQLSVNVVPSTVSNILWTNVIPTTSQAGQSVTISGQAVSGNGIGVPDGKPITISLPGSNAPTTTVYTYHIGNQNDYANYGYFTATLTPTKAGDYSLLATVDGNTYNFGTSISITSGPVDSGTITYGVTNISVGKNNAVNIHLQDAWGNGVPDKTVALSCNATDGGADPGVTQPGVTDANGNAIISEGPFNQPGIYSYSGSVDGVILNTVGTFSVQPNVSGEIYYASTQISVGQSNTVYFRVHDLSGNPLSGKTVTVSYSTVLGGNPPGLTQPGPTDSNGNTSVTVGPFTSGGTYTINGTVDGINLSTVSFTVIWSFDFTGSQQIFTVPNGIKRLRLESWGASGGGPNGGLGGYSVGEIDVNAGDVLYINVGEKGHDGIYNQQPNPGGWNGGGIGYNLGASGGGASDVRRLGTALLNRILVAAGGGGEGAYGIQGGVGGDLIGGTGQNGYNSSLNKVQYGGTGATQSSGGIGGYPYGTSGSLGLGGNGGFSFSTNGGGGGGGGYYGGGGGGGWSSSSTGAGGGGSSFIGGVQNGAITAGVNSGNGKVIITILP